MIEVIELRLKSLCVNEMQNLSASVIGEWVDEDYLVILVVLLRVATRFLVQEPILIRQLVVKYSDYYAYY